MTIYVIRHTGANYRLNYRHSYEITINEDTIYADLYFYRLKDAKKYLETLKYKEFYEIQKFKAL